MQRLKHAQRIPPRGRSGVGLVNDRETLRCSAKPDDRLDDGVPDHGISIAEAFRQSRRKVPAVQPRERNHRLESRPRIR
jgi:hypothetical protein